jgi:hypothetical protein
MPSARKIAVPAARSNAAALAVRKRLFMGALIACLVAAIVSPIITLSLRPDSAPKSVSVEPRLAAVAEQAGRDFLAGRNSSVPAAEGVNTNWSGKETPAYTAEDLQDPDKVADQNRILVTGTSGLEITSFALQGSSAFMLGDAQNVRAHHVRFRVTVNSAPYLLSVPVIDDPEFGTVLGGEPALLPATTGTRKVDPLDYAKGYSAADTALATPAVQKSITAWANAYAQGGANDDGLRAVVGDQSTSRTYNGLGGWFAKVVSIRNAVPIGGGDTNNPAGVLVQAEVRLSQTPFAAADSESLIGEGSELGTGDPAANGFTLSTTYDLYVVTEGNPAQPPVVAWGPAGSVSALTPYANAN